MMKKVERKKLAACMTCPLCHNLFRRPTTISECLHTFCKRCIYNKLENEDLKNCPVCKIHLGCTPVDKLRPDHCLQDLRVKIFPYKPKRHVVCETRGPGSVPNKALVPRDPSPSPELGDTSPIPAKIWFMRKERSLSSLVVNTPTVHDKPIQPATKSKHGVKKALALQEPIISDHEPVKNVDDRLSSPETLSKTAQSMRQNGTTSHPSKRHKSKQGKEQCDSEKADLLKPLNHLLEASSTKKVKLSKSIPPRDVWIQASDAKENENKVPKANVKEPSNEPKVCGHELDSSTSNSGSVMPNRPNGTILQEEAAVTGVINIPAQVSLDANSIQEQQPVKPESSNSIKQGKAVMPEGTYIPTEAAVDANTRQEQRLVPIWLSLIASKNRGNEAPLPQISSPYVMVKDGDISISAVRKYVVQKLGGSSEDEVELSTGGVPLLPALQLRNVVQWWLQSVPASGRVGASAGSSARDVVMPLYYSRKP
ncbi:E3 ubiquitin protein ligase DRIP1 [Linum perenne]